MFTQIKNASFIFHQRLISQISDRFYLKVLKFILYFISLFWKTFVGLKNIFFEYKLFSSHCLKIPVISVGNIVAGGTGKTPLVIKLLQTVHIERSAGLLSRGYKTGIKKQLIVKPQEKAHLLDEPALIQKKIPNVYCFLGKNRLKLGKIAEQKNIDFLIMDDGFQYRKIKKDFEIIAMNALDLFGQNYFLPRGLLRESPTRLKEADYIVINHVKNQDHYQNICSTLARYCNCPIIGTQPVLSFVDHETSQPLNSLRKVGVFCGIARPKDFIDMLIEKDMKIVSSLILSDHEKIRREKLEMFSKECQGKGAECIICTEKDASSFPSNLKLSVVIAKMDLNVLFGRKHWQLMIEKIQNRVNNCTSTAI